MQGDGVPVSRPVNNEVPLMPTQQIESDWAMKPAEKLKYDQLFNSLNPANGLIAGTKVNIDDITPESIMEPIKCIQISSVYR